jgi:hypothetical protein
MAAAPPSAAAEPPDSMRSGLGAFILLVTAAHPASAQDRQIPPCKALVAALQRDPSSVLNGSPLLSVDNLVADPHSTAERRTCTGIANYRDASGHITFIAAWSDDNRTGFDVNAHPTTADEAKSRAVALRNANHESGQDGTYAIAAYTPYCTDPKFLTMATNELHQGISAGENFYREPDYKILAIAPNGPGAGILANCVATIGNDTIKGQIFIGTNWVNAAAATLYQFYVLEAGPDGFKLTNRLWDLATE